MGLLRSICHPDALLQSQCFCTCVTQPRIARIIFIASGDHVMDLLGVFTGAAHQRVTKLSKVYSIFHFFCKKISNLAFTTDVGDCEGAIGHPFINQVFFVL
jgi:hypothetical protein